MPQYAIYILLHVLIFKMQDHCSDEWLHIIDMYLRYNVYPWFLTVIPLFSTESKISSKITSTPISANSVCRWAADGNTFITTETGPAKPGLFLPGTSIRHGHRLAEWCSLHQVGYGLVLQFKHSVTFYIFICSFWISACCPFWLSNL